MVISRSLAARQEVEGKVMFGSITLPLQEYIKVLGVDLDRELRFDRHLKHVAHQASLRVSALRRVAGLLDKRGIQLLYKAQIRPYLEYGVLTWISSAATHLQRLDKIERRVQRPPQQEERSLDTLEHRRDVAALVVFHKAQVQGVPHLARLQLPPRVAQRDTRTVLSSHEQVGVPRSRASQHQRTFISRVARLWNKFTTIVPAVSEMTTQQVKTAAHRWRGTCPTPMVLLTN
ncbi:uncharacterized protein LOC123515839 [Portunus trituberculatus]|uniref:uncharacterized protein LOC123515839 n=1 Tax=Portunus trituberculatus TaxID=210409 RepID=UPI001E1CDD74|nr:uncharacterized protein LOC123515839 [Portunus trituberculatus]